MDYSKQLNPEDFQAISAGLWRALRGEMSQTELSRALRYSYNKVYRIETGTTKATWDDFLMLCRTIKAPLPLALRRVHFIEGYPSASEVLKTASANASVENIARRLKVSPSSVRRWLSGEAVPDLGTVLHWLQVLCVGLEVFLETLIGYEQALKINPRQKPAANRMELLRQSPLAELLLRLLTMDILESGRFPDEADVKAVLRTRKEDVSIALENIKRVLGDREIQRILEKGDPMPRFHTGQDPSDSVKLMEYWMSTALDILRSEHAKSPSNNASKLFAYRIIATDRKTKEELHKLTRDYYQNVLNLLGRKRDKARKVDQAMVLGVQLADLIYSPETFMN